MANFVRVYDIHIQSVFCVKDYQNRESSYGIQQPNIWYKYKQLNAMMHAEGGFCIQRTFGFLDVSCWIPHLRYSIVDFSELRARNIMSKGLYEKDYDWIMDVLSMCGSFSILWEERRRTRLSNRIIYSCLQNSMHK